MFREFSEVVGTVYVQKNKKSWLRSTLEYSSSHCTSIQCPLTQSKKLLLASRMEQGIA